MAIKAVSTRRLSTNTAIAGSYGPMVITSVIITDSNYNTIDDTAILSTGGYIRILGVGFLPGYSLYLNGTTVAISSYQSSSEIRAVTPNIGNGTYNLTLFNTNGTGAIYALAFSGFPTWTSSTYTNQAAIVNVQLAVSGDAPLTYYLQGGSTLPTGVTLSSSGLLSGTIPGITTAQIYTFTVLVDDAQKQTAQQAITLNIQFGDEKWSNTTVLLNGDTTVTPFINDASTNNFGLTIVGDTRPDKFNPYTQGYYSVYYDGSSGIQTTNSSSNYTIPTSTTPFTLECWCYITAVGGPYSLISTSQTTYAYTLGIGSAVGSYDGTLKPWLGYYNGSAWVGLLGTVEMVRYTWYHVAAVFTGATCKIYINGVETGSGGPSTWGIVGGSDIIKIGTRNDSANYFFGHISNARVVIGTAVYTTSFTPSTVPLTAIPNTRLLTAQSNLFVDNSPLNAALTLTSAPKISSAIPFTQPTSVSVNTGTSVFFNGTTDYLTIASNAAFQFGTGDFTIEVWIWPNDLSANNTNNFINIGTYLTGIMMRTTSAGGIQLYFAGTSKVPVQAGLTAKAWNHVALVRIGTACTLYIGGAVNYSFTDSTSLSPATATVIIGMAAHNSSEFFNGYMSNMRIVKGSGVYSSTFTPSTSPLTAITSTQLLTLQGSQVIDASANNFAISATGAPKVVTNTYPFPQTTTTVSNLNTLGSSYFDGTGDYLQLPYSVSLYPTSTGTDYTAECWVYVTDVTTLQFIFGTNNTTVANWQITLGSSLFSYDLSGTSGNIGTAVANQWHHLAIVRSGSKVYAFLNGVKTIDTTASTQANNTLPLYIGMRNGSDRPLINGRIADLRIVNGTALYTSNFLPPQTPLTAITNTQLLTLQYNGGANNSGIIDNSNFNNIITRAGNVTQGTFSPYSQTGWSTFYNGTTDYQALALNAAFAIGTADFTVECWVNPSSATRVWGTIFAGVNYGAASDWGLYAGDGTTALYPMFFFTSGSTPGSGSGSTQGSFSLTSYTQLVIGAWSHIAVSRIAGIAKMFINGVQVGVTVTATAWSLANTLQKAVGGGFNGNANSLFPGYISNLRVVSGTGLYSAAFTPSKSPLSPVTGTVILTNQSNRFIDNSANAFALTTGGTPSAQAFSPFGGTTTTPTSYSTKFDNTTGSYFTFTGKASLALGTGDFTIESWVYRTQVVTQTDGWYTGTRSPTASGGLGIKVQNNGVVAWNTSTTYGQGTIAIPLFTWTHLAVTRESGTLKWYINGVLDYSTTLAQNFSNPTAAIGITDDPYYSSLVISNFRLVTGTAVYTGNFTPPTGPLTEITNTALLTCQSATLKDNSTVPATATQYGLTQRQIASSPFGQTSTTSVKYSPSVNGGSGYFDGTGDKLTIASYPTLPFGTNDFTIQCWFYTNVASTEQVIMTNGWSSYAPWLIRINTTNQAMLNMSLDGGSWTVNEQSLGAVTVGQWQHVAVTRASGTLRAFLNGTQTYTVSLASALYNGSQALTIGGRSDTTAMFNGYIADAQLINGTALYTSAFSVPNGPSTLTSNTSLLLNFTNGGIVDAHSTTVFESVGNAQLSTGVKKYGSAALGQFFNSSGAANYLTTVHNPIHNLTTGDFTIEFWIYPINWTVTNGWILCKDGVSSTNHPQWGIRLNGTGNILFAVGDSSGAVSVQILTTTGTVALNNWSHVACVRSGTTLTAYINGVSSATATQTVTMVATSRPLYVNWQGSGTTNDGVNAYLDDLRITKGFARYTATFTPSTSAFVGQ